MLKSFIFRHIIDFVCKSLFEKVLLSMGASPDYRDRCGQTPLYHSVLTGGDTSCCETLLYYRARLGVRDENGWDESHQVCVCNMLFDLLASDQKQPFYNKKMLFQRYCCESDVSLRSRHDPFLCFVCCSVCLFYSYSRSLESPCLSLTLLFLTFVLSNSAFISQTFMKLQPEKTTCTQMRQI